MQASRIARPLALTLAAALLPVLALTTPATAAGGCVSSSEALRVTNIWWSTENDDTIGMSRVRIERIFGTHGTTTYSGSKERVKRYRMCAGSPFKVLFIDYIPRAGAWKMYDYYFPS